MEAALLVKESRRRDTSRVPLFGKVLVANRGEIAVRIVRTCRVMGIPTVAVYSEADATARHVREADEAVPIGPAEASRSYLSIDALVRAAHDTGADAVHPGYGFLSQNGDFADAVRDAGLVFVGPPGDVHRRMGDKSGARRLMAAAGVPVVPGYDGDDQADARLLQEAKRIGWPVMLKPSRGGGGKGMRVVSEPGDFPSALAASRREATAAFGDDAMVIERFVERPRHVEVQVLADGEGRIIHLGERECSVQRRHQKVVEETPSPALDAASRAALCRAGVEAARAASYLNAGTVEFLLGPDGSFFFLEMNTRLQVEHPVTEAVTGLDLVRLQLEVAAGRPLAWGQDAVVSRGHALECRLYAEDPERDDLPSPGRVLHLSEPEGPGIRVDSGIAAGSEVSIHSDPLLAKIVTAGADRGESIERMRDALWRTVVLGVVTNLARLRAIVSHPAFEAGDLHTGFIEANLGELTPRPCPPPAAVAALAAVLERPTSGAGGAGRPPVPDPWARLGPWRLGEGA
jgi:acetyl-CoA carboxylase biotin carboxylase subunit